MNHASKNRCGVKYAKKINPEKKSPKAEYSILLGRILSNRCQGVRREASSFPSLIMEAISEYHQKNI